MNIYALSTGRGPSGIAIIRLSGNNILDVCKTITKIKNIERNKVNFCKFMIQKIIIQLIPKQYYYGFQNLIVLLGMI